VLLDCGDRVAEKCLGVRRRAVTRPRHISAHLGIGGVGRDAVDVVEKIGMRREGRLAAWGHHAKPRAHAA
jgi:hypothetical protein